MKSLARYILSVALITPLWAHADTPPPTPGPSESQLVEHGSYINKDGVGFTRLRIARTVSSLRARLRNVAMAAIVSEDITNIRVHTTVAFRAGLAECRILREKYAKTLD